MLYVKEAAGTVDEAVARLQEAAAANKFGVLGVIDLREKMAAKGVSFGPQCRIVEVCNPQQAKKVLEANPAISTALPCRISVYEQDGKVKVATLLPTALLELFGNPAIRPVAQEVEAVVRRIVDAAAG